ncbi:hypothetical protein CTEN210_05681 [Chaetoceros tenuissimus]|uniref:ShKT domain-containing protein n=1 Tax=Chaetoceros tenuissimus TaxID=426638 RepID=A0AAD3H3P4_9STRA|nr:hypothetical protein CTEN210_05681 [Chaetoceros tenuissimus]
MDDNHRLIEWLAYHHFALPLRRLIVMTDPRSKTSPLLILQRWEKYMTIDLWHDNDVFSEQELDDRSHENTIKLHRSRQHAFNVKCMQTLKGEGATWTLMTDVDEYIHINPNAWNPNEFMYQENTTPILMLEPASVLKMLKQIDLSDDRLHLEESKACMPVSRFQFGGIESTRQDVSMSFPKELGLSIVAKDFDTLRWRYYGADTITGRDGVIPAKTIIDLSAVPTKDEWRMTGDPHRPFEKLCSEDNLYLDSSKTVFVLVNHYLGALGEFAARDDSRFVDRVLHWEERKRVGDNHHFSDELRQWLPSFVKNMGVDEARRLLANVGQVQVQIAELPCCSLNFFGPLKSFKAISLPSIIKNILIPNAKYNCDIVIHYGTLPSENEDDISNTDADAIHDLGEMSKVIAANIGKSPPSVNVKDDKKVESFKAITSIQSAWTLMEDHALSHGFEYGRVAFFRLDAFYAVPVDIFKVDKDTYDYGNRYAVIPAFGKYPVNDQMIYGPTEAVKIWAMTSRNDIIDTSEPASIGLASAHFMANVIVPTIMDKAACYVVKNPDVCFYRTRAPDVVLINDCSDEQGAPVRGVQDIDQVELVENLVQRECTKALIEASEDEEVELHCDKSSWAVSSRFLQTTLAPAPAPIVTRSITSEVTVAFNGERNVLDGILRDLCALMIPPAQEKALITCSANSGCTSSVDCDTIISGRRLEMTTSRLLQALSGTAETTTTFTFPENTVDLTTSSTNIGDAIQTAIGNSSFSSSPPAGVTSITSVSAEVVPAPAPALAPVFVGPCDNVNCKFNGKCEVKDDEGVCNCPNTFETIKNGKECACPEGTIRNTGNNRCEGPPTAAPTSTPTTTPAPTAPEDICVDSTTGTFTLDNVGKDVTCAWLTRNSQQTSDRIAKYCGRNSVKFLCPLSCNACETPCVDDSSFTFQLKNQDKTKNCSWLLKNQLSCIDAKRIGEYCTSDFEEGAVKEACFKSCGQCPDDRSTPNDPSCQDDSAFRFELLKTSKEKSCTWLTKNKGKAAKRIAKYCTDTVYDGAVKANCADSCGLCPI